MTINEGRSTSNDQLRDELRARRNEDTRSPNPIDDPQLFEVATRAGGSEDERGFDDSAGQVEQQQDVTRAGGPEDEREFDDSAGSVEQRQDVTRAGGPEDTRSDSVNQNPNTEPGAPDNAGTRSGL